MCPARFIPDGGPAMAPRNGHHHGLDPRLDPLDEPAEEAPAEDERDLATGEGGAIEVPLTPEDIDEDD
jgi:hypothetical protein